jgi:hypothetical protein
MERSVYSGESVFAEGNYRRGLHALKWLKYFFLTVIVVIVEAGREMIRLKSVFASSHSKDTANKCFAF